MKSPGQVEARITANMNGMAEGMQRLSDATARQRKATPSRHAHNDKPKIGWFYTVAALASILTAGAALYAHLMVAL